MYYRIRTRIGSVNGKIVVVADNLPSLEEVYKVIIKEGKGTGRHFYIDKVNPKLFSKVTAKIAMQRLDEIRMNKENEE